MKRRKYFSLRKKLILMFVLFLLLPLLLTGIMIHKTYYEYFLKKEINLSKQKLDELTSKLNEYITQIEQLSFDVCYHNTVQEMFTDFIPNRFIGARAEYEYFRTQFGINRLDNLDIYYLKTADLNNELGFSVGTTFREDNGFDKIFTEQSLLKTFWHTPREITTFANEHLKIVSFYQNIADEDYKQSIGTIRIDILESVLKDMLFGYNYQSESMLFLLGSQDEIISSTIDNPSSILSNSELRKHSDYVLPVNNLKNDWKLLCVIPSSVIEEQAFGIRQYAAITALAGISFTIFLCIIFSFIITKPLHQLITLTQNIKKGNLNIKTGIHSKDEFGELAKSFNNMTASLTELIEINAEIKRQESIAELLYLQSQINPHFLYNTLDSIRFTARKNKDFEVGEQIEKLSFLFRYYLNTHGEYVSFREEIKHIQTYMEIQILRFHDELSYEIIFEENIYDLYTIKLILQPIVENAIIHGFVNKLSKGNVKITGFIQNEMVTIQVDDNGIGMNQDLLLHHLIEKEYSSNYKTFALKNINDRLKLHFGQQYGITIKSKLGHGTSVIITLPVLAQIPKFVRAQQCADWSINETVNCRR